MHHHFLSQEAGGPVFVVDLYVINRRMHCTYFKHLVILLLIWAKLLYHVISFVYFYEQISRKRDSFWTNKCGFLANNIKPSSVFTVRSLEGMLHTHMIGGGILPVSVLPVPEWRWCMGEWDWARGKRKRRRRERPRGRQGAGNQAILVSSPSVLLWKSESWIIHSLWEVNNDGRVIEGCMLMSWSVEGFPTEWSLTCITNRENRNEWKWSRSSSNRNPAGVFNLTPNAPSCVSTIEEENPCLKMMNNAWLQHHAELCLHAGVSYEGRGLRDTSEPLHVWLFLWTMEDWFQCSE